MLEQKLPLISIITPVYNCKRYLVQCVDSILAQSYTKFELLLIDDGSTDGTGRVCDEYSVIDSRIRVYHKANGGVSSARNLGIENATGEWITFVDADDVIDVEALSVMWQEMDDEVDFIMCGYQYMKNDRITYVTSLSSNRFKDSRDKGISQMFKNEYWSWFICSKLFRKQIIMANNIRFDQSLSYGEDYLFVVIYLSSIKYNIIITASPIYSYRIHSDSAEGRGYAIYDEKNITGFIATIKIYNCILNIETTNENRCLALNALVNSYNVQRRMIRESKKSNTRRFKLLLNALINEYMSPLKYVSFIVFRKIVVCFPRLEPIFINYFGKNGN